MPSAAELLQYAAQRVLELRAPGPYQVGGVADLVEHDDVAGLPDHQPQDDVKVILDRAVHPFWL